ncbi:MAG: peptidoglycan-binding domain-containing protein [Acidobacteriota bacterium]
MPERLRIRVMKYEDEAGQDGQAGDGQGARPASAGAQGAPSQDGTAAQTTARSTPRANAPYTLEIDGDLTSGNLDDEGVVECSIRPSARAGRLVVDGGTPNELVYEFRIGHLNPITETSGVKQRLANLGFGCGDLTEEPTPGFAAALRAFQEKNGLTVTGEADEATRSRLRDLHQS